VKRITKVVEHLRVEEIDARLRRCTEPWRIRRWHVIRCALVHPKPAAEIALEVGLARQTVHNLVAAYNRQGPQVLETPGHGQRQRAYLSLRQEQALVDKFRKKSAAGQISTAPQCKPVIERVIGRQVHKTTVYRLLKRHQWRKVVPRHPQASAAEQTAFKKPSRSKSGRSCNPALPGTPGRY
jgi:transposase